MTDSRPAVVAIPDPHPHRIWDEIGTEVRGLPVMLRPLAADLIVGDTNRTRRLPRFCLGWPLAFPVALSLACRGPMMSVPGDPVAAPRLEPRCSV